MSAWETTQDDVKQVLKAHKIRVSDERLKEIHDSIDHDKIEDNVLRFYNMEAQTDSMLEDIEDQLMESGVIPVGNKKFIMHDEYENDEEDDEWAIDSRKLSS